MNEYSPFLKFKQGEVSALSQRSPADRKHIVPLFELPRDDLYSELTLKYKIDKIAKKIKKHIEMDLSFYIDNYEVSDKLKINKEDSYLYLLDVFSDFDIIPIIGFDRTERHNSIAVNYANKKSKKLALRMTYDYFDSFLAYKDDLDKWLSLLDKDIPCILILDCNYIDDKNVGIYTKSLITLLSIIENKTFNKVILSGSSIPASIGDKVKMDTNVSIIRNEVEIYKKIKPYCAEINLIFGDYTVISPGYSEITIEPDKMFNVITSKIVYSQLDLQYFTRGNKIKKLGFTQYFEQAKDIISQSFFRGRDFSYGDEYIYEVAVHRKRTAPSAIICPTVNAHIKFMINEINKEAL
jgi:hypothetical protein